VRSSLLVGTVRHHRVRPRDYALTHHVYYLALDLDELDAVGRAVPLLRFERSGLLSVHARDHLGSDRVGLAAGAREHLAREGFDAAGWQIALVTNARVLGYLFNPVSFYLCRDAAGTLRVVLAEVGNTHGDRCVYTLRPEPGAGAAFAASARKRMYVSPFIGMDATYRFHILEDAGGLVVSIQERERCGDADVLTLWAGFRLRRRPLTQGTLLRAVLRHPLITLQTIALIHLHALRLWTAGVPFLRYRKSA